MKAKLQQLWKNEYVQTATVIGLIILIFFGIWYGATLALNNPNPIVVVPSPSMSIPANGKYDGWGYPFDRTLQVGDLLILQGVDPRDLNTDYPNSDIIVFHNPTNPTDTNDLIVHRIAASTELNGTLYFQTKGDGNRSPPSYSVWPTVPPPEEYDPWARPGQPGVSEELVVGKVIMRVPWAGNIVLFMKTREGLVTVVILVALLLIIEFVIPEFKKKQKPANSVSKKKEEL